MAGLLYFSTALGASAIEPQSLVSPRLSGTYAFHGAVQDARDRFVTLSGTLGFDWLGDISGEAMARSRGRRGAAVGIACHVMIEGSYRRTRDPEILDGTLGIIPVSGNCGTELAAHPTWSIKIVPGPNPGRLDLFQRTLSARWFIGTATPESSALS